MGGERLWDSCLIVGFLRVSYWLRLSKWDCGITEQMLLLTDYA